MTRNAKGSNAERELLHMFWGKEWACLRSAGSGSMKYPGPDLIVGNREMNRRLAIECKCTGKGKVYLNQWDMNQLKDFAKIFDARPFFAIKVSRKGWFFLMPEDVETTNTGFVIDFKVAERRGLLFDELISYEIRKIDV